MIWEGAAVEHWRSSWGVPQLVILSETTSTNDVVRSLADDGAAAGTVVIADWQSAGRGRSGGRWEADRGTSLLMSMLLKPAHAAAHADLLGTVPVRVGMAALQALHGSGVPASWKWPNDLLLDGRKLGGILCESVLGAGSVSVVAGLGVNVTQSYADWSPAVRAMATSVQMAGVLRSRAELAGGIIAAMLPLAHAPLQPFSTREMERLAAHDALRGREVLVDNTPRGTAAGIAPDGALLLRDDAGLHTLRAGTVRLLEETT